MSTREQLAMDHGHAVSDHCEKCAGMYGDGYVSAYHPFGGATSFADALAWKDTRKLEAMYSSAAYDFRDLSQNILNDPETTPAEKGQKLEALGKEYQRVLASPETFYPEYKEDARAPRGKFQRFIANLKAMVSGYGDDDEDEDEEEEDKELDLIEGSFKLIETANGVRWLTFSSNSFEDLEGEIVSQKALEDAVDYADESGERGPLRVFHVDGADIGDADYQAIIGKFLVESGTFRDDDLGRAAVKYFREHRKEKFQVSIGFIYQLDQKSNGIYHWVRIQERSVLPEGDAANPYTRFFMNSSGEEKMDDRKSRMLTAMFGEKIAGEVIAKAEATSKDLVDQGIANKAAAAPDYAKLLIDLKGLMSSLPEDKKSTLAELLAPFEPQANRLPDPTPASVPASDPAPDLDKALEPVIAAMRAIHERVQTVEAAIVGLDEIKSSINGIKDMIKEAESNLPAAAAFHASSSSKNIVEDEVELKKMLGIKEEAPASPAMKYLADLAFMGRNGSGN